MRQLVIRSTMFLAIAFTALCFTERVASQESFDIIIENGRVVDGTGAPWYVADIGVRDGFITAIGDLDERPAATRIDATGLIVAPGFIDMMGQSATPMLRDPTTAMNLLRQGITTINAGEGASAAPLDEEESLRNGWSTMAEYFTLLDTRGMPVNVVQTIGHTQVRRLVIGDDQRRPSDAELEQMRALVREAMEAGAIGVSTALIYPPAVYASYEEIAALVEVAGEYGGGYYTHMRNEGDQLLEAIDEAIKIGRHGDAPVHIFHLKAAGEQNWPKMQLAIATIVAARAEGFQVTADIYPYINNGLGIAAMIHPRHFVDGYERLRGRLDDPELRAEIRTEMETTAGWENWYRHVGHDWNRIIIGQSNDRRYAPYVGQSVADIAAATEQDPWDVFFAMVKAGAFALPQSMTESNKILAMQQPFVSFCTDVGPSAGGRSASHPRSYGSFPRLFARYVRELGVLTLERAISQASATAANDILAFDRGRIAIGLAADIIVFDEEKFIDRATFAEPDKLADGMLHVVVNGVTVLRDGEFTGSRPGKVLRGPGYRAEEMSHSVRTGEIDPRLISFDERMKAFLERHRIPGAAIAVTDQGRLVLARGYGMADIANRQPVEPTSLFRIASISKPVTAVAILKLVEEGKLSLDDPVFEILPYAEAIADLGDKVDDRLGDITIRQLLHHRGGWDRDASFDAMFQSVRFAERLQVDPPADPDTVIRAMLSEPLDFEPGERYAYSNFGYCLLGRIIEQVSGMSYEEYVRQHVLEPIGITQMRVGSTRLPGRHEGEVRYYTPFLGTSVFATDLGLPVSSAYGGWNLEAMDSHGGWIASAVDLARFAAALHDWDDSPLLSEDSIDLMYARSPDSTSTEIQDPAYYSLGWLNREVGGERVNHWHTGSLPGTATILIQRHDGRCFVALFNTRTSPYAGHLGREADALLHRAANDVLKWPEFDLFDKFE